MSVYVDTARNKYHRMVMCHLMADSLEELHAFAAQLGMKQEWYQPVSTPHYDLSLARRAMALKLGAVEIDNKKVVELIQKYRTERVP